jgi:UDP-N-acetyl-D-galactosamine dehydrogenase
MQRKISVVGLGYVGLPLAVAFGQKTRVIGFDINQTRIQELKESLDRTREVSSDDLRKSDILFTNDPKELKGADFHIVAVPTPVDEAKRPDMTAVLRASETVGKTLKKGDIVVYESTVYPGATEDDCVPVLEKFSGLRCGVDFFVGYSPERINPGDTEHTFTKIKKVVSGQDAKTLQTVAEVYSSVVTAGVHLASSIKVAEAAKVIENIQRDVNISLMNELAMIFHKMGLDTHSVLEAARTKWNFLPFSPGLVGGHCIGVDPYYLTHKAATLGYTPQVILSGRRINDEMGVYIAAQTVKALIRRSCQVRGARITVLGLTFKENVPDIRNTRVIDIIRELEAYGVEIQVCDPLAEPAEVKEEYGLKLCPISGLQAADGVVLAVSHTQFKAEGWKFIQSLLRPEGGIVVDVKSVLPPGETPQGISLWRL